MRRNWNKLRITTPVFGDNFFRSQLGFDPLGVSAFLIHFIDCNNNRYPSGPCVLNRFFRLRHHTIVGGHDQNDDIGRLGAPCAHCGEGRVARRIEKGNHPLTGFHVIRANMLGDSTRFATCNP